MNSLKIHWCLPLDNKQKKAGQQRQTSELDFDGIVEFAQEAEALGIDTLLMGMGFHMPDPLPMLGALVRETSKIKFMLAYRPGLLSPTLFTQIVNTVSWMSNKRIALNIVAGISPAEQAYYGDFLNHDERYERTNEFLDIMHRFWRKETPLNFEGQHYRINDARLGLGFKDGERPQIYISGASEVAQQTAIDLGDCWLRYGDTPEGIAKASAPVLAGNCRVGIRVHVLARETRQDALEEIMEMMRDPDLAHKEMVKDFVAKCDSSAVKTSFALAEQAENNWLSPMLWSGAVAYRGGPALCVVGSYEEVAQYLHSYKAAGVSEFIFSGWPTGEEMRRFCLHVLPIIRRLEQEAKLVSSPVTEAEPA